MAKLSCWVVTDANTGTENQCRGLAETLGLDPVLKHVWLRGPWKQLSPWLGYGKRFAFTENSDPIEPPWPDVVISAGRHAVVASMSIRQRSRGRSFTVHLQNPMVSPRHFDLLAVSQHDRIRGPKVLVTRGVLHRVSPERLAEGMAQFGAAYQHLPQPRISVLIGGDNGAYRLSPTFMGDLAEQLVALARRYNGSLLVTPSRRTGADNEAILRARMREVPSVVWDGTGENPYFAFLALSDALIVTCDSVSMISEACYTGKPVFLVMLEGDSARFSKFHDMLLENGMIRRFEGQNTDLFAVPRMPPLDDFELVAGEVRRRLAARGVIL